MRFDFGIEDIFRKLSRYLSIYFGITLESLENFREFFEYKISFFPWRIK